MLSLRQLQALYGMSSFMLCRERVDCTWCNLYTPVLYPVQFLAGVTWSNYIYYCSYHRIVLHFFFAKFYKGLRICLFIVFRNVERWDPFIFAKCYKGLRNCMFIVFGIVGRWDPYSRFLSFLLQSIALAASAGRVPHSLRVDNGGCDVLATSCTHDVLLFWLCRGRRCDHIYILVLFVLDLQPHWILWQKEVHRGQQSMLT